MRTPHVKMSPKILVHFKLDFAIIFFASIIFSSASAEETAWTTAELDAGRAAAVVQQNLHRSHHCAQPLKMDPELNKVAQTFAETLAKENELKHSDNDDVGENVFFTSVPSSQKPDPKKIFDAAVASWYLEKQDYKGKWTDDPVIGDFTQIVWKETTTVGMGIAKSTKVGENGEQDIYVVFNYKPQGNIDVPEDEKELRKNVQGEAGDCTPSQGRSNANSNSMMMRDMEDPGITPSSESSAITTDSDDSTVSDSSTRSSIIDDSDSSPRTNKLSVFVGILSLASIVFSLFQ